MEEVVSAIYNKSKFDYNPNKIKVSDLLTDEYHCYEVVDNKGSILSKQKERRDARAGLVKTSESDIPKRSTQRMYSMEKDWNPEINPSKLSALPTIFCPKLLSSALSIFNAPIHYTSKIFS